MKQFVLKCGNVFDVMCKIAVLIGGTGLVLMAIFIAWQVFGRFVLNDTPTWTEPIALLLMLYFILLVAAVGVRENFHLGLDLLLILLPDGVRKWVEIASFSVVSFLGFAMMIYGWNLAMGTWGERIPAISLPEGVRFLPMFISGFMIGLFAIERIMHLALGIDRDNTTRFAAREEQE